MKKDFICLVIITVLTVLGTMKLYNNQKDYLNEVEQKYKDGMALNLDGSVTKEALSDLLEKYNYIEEKSECNYVAGLLMDSIINKNGRLPNLGTLNQPKNNISERMILGHENECPGLIKRLQATYSNLGLDEEVKEIYEKNTSFGQGNGDVTLNVKVVNKDKNDKSPLGRILVRLRKHTVDTIDHRREVVENVGYQWTDDNGIASFKVYSDSCYSVFPIKQGYEYGTARGTKNGEPFADGQTLLFKQKENKIKILDSYTFRNIKEDNAMTVRTPAEYKGSLFSNVIMVLIAWWLAYIFLKIMDAKRNRGEKHEFGTIYGLKATSDYMLFVILMAINCICILITFGICDPLKDMPNGVTMASGSIAGIVVMCFMACINYVKFRNNKSKAQLGFLKFDFVMQPFRWLGKICNIKALDKVPDGFGYLLVALFFVIMLRLFGKGPEGSDARVNLFFFQPSELSKFFIVIFIAAFFAKNADRIRDFSTDIKYLKPQIKTVLFVAVAIIVLMGMYLFLISDMGPALVILVTFIILYSVARQDLIQMAVGVVTFFIVMAVCMVLGSFMGEMGGFMVKLILPLLWFVAWISYFWYAKRKIYESAIFLNLLFFMFSFVGTVFSTFNLPGGQRLANRMAMYGSGVWDNTVSGGDQVAQGIWGLASGGWTGQGLGRGNANFIPAFHTDMVLESVGEVLGFFALVFIVVCFFFLIYRSLLLARKAAHPFLFFTISGIALVTLVQFLVILLGSLGLIPLTGVAVPFLSFGRASLIINLAAFGIVISMSRYQPKKEQIEYIKSYDNVLVAGMCSFMVISCCIICVLFYYQKLRQDTYLVKPAAIADSSGKRYFEYNPRISQVLRRLKQGDIYDRNGVVLATADPAIITAQLDTLSNSGLNRSEMEVLAKKHPRRYYPFGDYLFFMLGNYNTKMLWGNTDHADFQSGYFAEERHFSDLRGFDNKGEKVELVSKKFQQSPFLPPEEYREEVIKRDYNIDVIMAGLKNGVDCKAVKEWNSTKNIEKRKLVLTVDAALQKRMHEGLKKQVMKLAKEEGKDSFYVRASVVVLDANKGDLLCSASWPMADQSLMKEMAKTSPNITYKEKKGEKAFTDRDLGTTYQTQPGSTAKTVSAMAAFMKYGTEAQKITYSWHSKEGIDDADEDNGGKIINIKDGLIKSLNPFFIKLVNEGDGLYKELNKIYYSVGIGVMITKKDDYKAAAYNENLLKKAPFKCFTPYYFLQQQGAASQADFNQVMRVREELALSNYRIESKKTIKKKLNNHYFAMPWGQGEIRATPLNIARAYSVIANKGSYVPTRYKMDDQITPIKLMDDASADILWADLIAAKGDGMDIFRSLNFGGKTGTPERGASNAIFTKFPKNKKGIKNDSWYACILRSNGNNLAIAIRIERTAKMSKEARTWVHDMVMPALREAGYVNY